MMFRRRDLQELDLTSALEVARQAATRAGIAFKYRFEEVSPASSLVVSPPNSAAAEVTISTIEPGVAFLDIGIGMRGEWLLRSEEELAGALADFGAIFEAVFRGDVEERVRRFPCGRHSVRGFVMTPTETFRFRHHAVGLAAEPQVYCYAPYAKDGGDSDG